MIPQTPAASSTDAPNPFDSAGRTPSSLSSPSASISAMRIHGSSPSPLASGSAPSFNFGPSSGGGEQSPFDFNAKPKGWPGNSGAGPSSSHSLGGGAGFSFGGPSSAPIPPTPGVGGGSFNFGSAPPVRALSLKRPPQSQGGGQRASVPSGAVASTTTKGPVTRPTLPPSSSSSAPTSFVTYTPATLLPLLTPSTPTPSSSKPTNMLLLDIRPHSAFTTSHLVSSISICIPSTLLRRATYTLSHLIASLGVSDQIALRSASSVIVIDADAHSLKEGQGVRCLLEKFQNDDAFTGTLGWVKGGFCAIKNECVAKSLVSKLIESGFGGGTSSAGTSSADPSERSTPSASTPGKHSRPILSVKDLPQSAFTQSSTAAFVHSGSGRSSHGGRPTSSHSNSSLHGHKPPSSSGSGSLRPNLVKRRKSGGGMSISLDQMNTHLQGGSGIVGMGVGEGSATPGAMDAPGAFKGEPEKRMATNPFFDNIRQNSEALSLDRSMVNLSPIELPSVPDELLFALPAFLAHLVRLPPIERSQVLARQFYDLEVAERERLEGTLNWHANHQGKEDEGDPEEAAKFKKFGISAGVELGSLNRFKNIFPYEHARVKLHNHGPHATDYINASHIRLQNSPMSFIASQGPLHATFPDFWQMCEQENVGVIIMLTNLEEGGREKCGRYWVKQHGCEWDVDVEGEDEHVETGGGGFFATPKTAPPKDDARTVRRTITIHSSQQPHLPPRKIRHIQYRAWPDFDIPAKPADVVELVHEVETAQRDYLAEIGWRSDASGLRREPPVLAHCSAGVGRTGVFIMVSSMLEKLRRQRKSKRGAELARDDDTMDIDDEDSSRPSMHRGSSASANSASSTSPLPSPASIASSSDSAAIISAGLSASTLEPTNTNATDSSSSLSSNYSAVNTTGSTAATSPSPSPINLSFSAASLQLPPLDQPDPIFAATNEMREYRMSMVANYRQYVCVHECVLEGMMREVAQEMQ